MSKAGLALGVGMLALISAAPAGAQGEGTTTPVAHNHVISASPLLMMFKWFNVDHEGKISPAVTLGASGSYLPLGGDFDYQRATFHARYYPHGAAPTGFYMGAQTGVHRAGTKRDHRVGTGIDLARIGRAAVRMFRPAIRGRAATARGSDHAVQ